MTKPIYQYNDTAVVKDGHTMFPQDACKDLQCLQRKVAKLEQRLSCSAQSSGSVSKTLQLIEKASNHIDDLCQGKARWTMSVPVNEDTIRIAFCKTH